MAVFCVDCKHSQESGSEIYCVAPNIPLTISLVYGEGRIPRHCYIERGFEKDSVLNCGASGQWFEKKDAGPAGRALGRATAKVSV